ncbi:hypothetical protein SAMN04489730_0141 [Amycolatopsis australiensis]|uniref:Uncharacterized protein n=1 Tax=Amycolatopsis australiensis TaxID=546364 RepID=A0A1K1LQI6_9PSEU|nr:hypothetical protein SAMN04489730_0141 [Amycolatopsis australiensis]
MFAFLASVLPDLGQLGAVLFADVAEFGSEVFGGRPVFGGRALDAFQLGFGSSLGGARRRYVIVRGADLGLGFFTNSRHLCIRIPLRASDSLGGFLVSALDAGLSLSADPFDFGSRLDADSLGLGLCGGLARGGCLGRAVGVLDLGCSIRARSVDFGSCSRLGGLDFCGRFGSDSLDVGDGLGGGSVGFGPSVGLFFGAGLGLSPAALLAREFSLRFGHFRFGVVAYFFYFR